jgi:hypothetical protein
MYAKDSQTAERNALIKTPAELFLDQQEQIVKSIKLRINKPHDFCYVNMPVFDGTENIGEILNLAKLTRKGALVWIEDILTWNEDQAIPLNIREIFEILKLFAVYGLLRCKKMLNGLS